MITEEERIKAIEERWPGGSKFREEEPLKGYRQYVLEELSERYCRSLLDRP